MKYNYIGWNDSARDYSFFETEKEVKEWIETEMDLARDNASAEGWDDSVDNGGIGYAKIIEFSMLKVTDEKKNYPCLKNPDRAAECSACENKDCETTEEWPYSSEFDYICDGYFEKKGVEK